MGDNVYANFSHLDCNGQTNHIKDEGHFRKRILPPGRFYQTKGLKLYARY